MNDTDRKIAIQNTFNTVAPGYGNSSMEFFKRAAAILPGIFRLQGNEHLLDVATGTGIAANELASQLVHGKITGVDFSTGMLAQAKQNLSIHKNIELKVGDMTELPFADKSFDCANCSFGIFFVEDMVSLLNHIASKIQPKGKLVTCSFQPYSFTPFVDLFLSRIEGYGVAPPEFSWKRISTEEQYRTLYQQAGLRTANVYQHDVSYAINDAEGWWNIVWYAGFRGLVNQLNENQLTKFKQEHLDEVQQYLDKKDKTLNVGVIFGEAIV